MLFAKSRQADKAKCAEAVSMMAALDKVQAVIWFDLEGNILDANALFLSALGYELGDVKGKHHSMFVSPEFGKSSEYKDFWAKLSQGENHRGEFLRFGKAGKPVWIEASYNPVLDEAGKPVKVVKFAIDVTETKRRVADVDGKMAAISKAQAVIEFGLDGIVQTANENFLNTLGYRLDDIVGKHHRMFVESSYAESPDYRSFWQKLNSGEYVGGEFMRIKKNGEEIWIQATYNPIMGADGKPVKIVKFATDITKSKMAASDAAGQLAAISKSQAVIEFSMDGSILTANDNFLRAVGYSLDEIKGKHHRLFMEPKARDSADYAEFWRRLRSGEFQSGEYKRLGKGGKEITIQASYNPILDLKGNTYKVVKYASLVSDKEKVFDALAEKLAALSNGDLSVRLPELPAEFSDLRNTFNKMVMQLDDLVMSIVETSDLIADASKSIAESATGLATRGERQAATVEETSAAMEELSATVRGTAENASTATQSADAATRNAEKGGEIVTKAVGAMSRIEASTQMIGKIVEVIDGIAFQTNLLALNAGVEAARAGDAGRGFSVVASEVRALAQRASDSAKEINELINTSNKEVELGAELVKNSGEALSEIVSGVANVAANIRDILTASQEQARAITEVNEAVSEIDKTTQHTAAMAEESAAASNELAERAKHLRMLVSFFSTSEKPSASKARVESGYARQMPAPARHEETEALPLKAASGGWDEF